MFSLSWLGVISTTLYFGDEVETVFPLCFHEMVGAGKPLAIHVNFAVVFSSYFMVTTSSCCMIVGSSARENTTRADVTACNKKDYANLYKSKVSAHLRTFHREPEGHRNDLFIVK